MTILHSMKAGPRAAPASDLANATDDLLRPPTGTNGTPTRPSCGGAKGFRGGEGPRRLAERGATHGHGSVHILRELGGLDGQR